MIEDLPKDICDGVLLADIVEFVCKFLMVIAAVILAWVWFRGCTFLKCSARFKGCLLVIATSIQARSQDLEKGWGVFFERVTKVQTTLIRIFIVLESESHGLSENWEGISRKAGKFERFFRPKTGGLPQKKGSSPKLRLIFRPKSEIQTFFPPKNRWSPKKKRSSPKLRLIFRPKSEIQTLF